MITKIRRSAFETNSSSTHSFTLGPGDYDKIPDIRCLDGVAWLHGGEFGWGPDQFTDATTKCAYCVTWLKTVHEYDASVDVPAKEQMLVKVVAEETGAQHVILHPNSEGSATGYDWGYIDHQSIEGGGVGAEIFADADTLRRFIFDRASVLVIDNGNH